MTFVDTSAFIAFINVDDPQHEGAIQTWGRLINKEDLTITSSYTLIETMTLLHRRHGTSAVEEFLKDIMPIVEVVWADVPMHTAAVTAMLAHPGKSGPSLVDCMSLEVVRRRRIKDVFAYDRHFEGRGLNLLR